MLKLVYPHREAEHEADALAYWNGNGAVRLVIELCEPGTRLSEIEPNAALDVLIGLLTRLWKPAARPSVHSTSGLRVDHEP